MLFAIKDYRAFIKIMQFYKKSPKDTFSNVKNQLLLRVMYKIR